MPVQPDELHELAMGLQAEYGTDTIAAASVIALTRRLFRQYAAKRGINLDPMIQLQVRCMTDWSAHHNIDSKTLDRSVDALMRAGALADSLDAIPGDVTSSCAPALPINPATYRQAPSAVSRPVRAKLNLCRGPCCFGCSEALRIFCVHAPYEATDPPVRLASTPHRVTNSPSITA